MKTLLPFRVNKGALVPANRYCYDQMTKNRYSAGDLVMARITKPRNPKFNAFMHAGFARVIKENIDDFKLLSVHDVLKKIQVESGIECDTLIMMFDGTKIPYRVPRSLSFESMGEERFRSVFRSMSYYIIENYWPMATEDQIEEMSRKMANE